MTTSTTLNATSFTKTPQAGDDLLTLNEDSSLITTLGAQTILTFDVMANDAGGAAKRLWSVDDQSAFAGLSTSDIGGTWEDITASATNTPGIKMRIVDGKVQLDLTAALAQYDGSIQGMDDGDTITGSFFYTIRLANGTLSRAEAKFTINGTNDAPVATIATNAVLEDDVITGTLQANDADAGETLTFQTVGTVPTGFSLDSATGAYSFDASSYDNLAQGEKATVTITFVANDGTTNSAPQTLTITITGANDAPVIAIANSDIEGDVVEDGTQTATGTIVAADVDNEAVLTYSAAQTEGDNLGTFDIDEDGNWTFNLTNSAVQALGQGETTTVTYTVTVTDEHGATDTQDVTITITGDNDAPTIASADTTGSVTEDGTEIAIGTIVGADVDNGAVLSYASALKSGDGSLGSFSIDEDGNWTFDLDNAAAQSLAGSTSVDLVYTVTVSDEFGGTVTQDVKITINGANEPVTVVTAAPVVTATSDTNDNSGGGAASLGASAGNDTMRDATGANATNSLDGLAGNDTIYGRGGDDTLNGSAGNDVLYGGTDNDSLNGGSELDQLFGGSGNDVLSGGAGNDSLTGGFGADTLTGGLDNDRFIFLSESDRGDVITDFKNPGADLIVLTSIDANTALINDQAFAWGGTTATVNGLWYVDNGNGTSTFYADTNGSADTAEFWFTVNGNNFDQADLLL